MDMIQILIIVVVFAAFIVSRGFIKSHVGRVIRSVILTFVVAASAGFTGVEFTLFHPSWSAFLVIVWVAFFAGSVTFNAIEAANERANKIEAERYSQFKKEYRGKFERHGHFIVLKEHPGLVFDLIRRPLGQVETEGDAAAMKDGDLTVLTVDTDPNAYYGVGHHHFSDGSFALPIRHIRNLTLFPEDAPAS